jgi:hypothetical protein
VGKMLRSMKRRIGGQARPSAKAKETAKRRDLVALKISVGRKRSHALVQLVEAHFPREVSTKGRHDDWAVAGPAFVARSTRLVQAILALPNEHETAAAVLARVLYEHVVTFTWIAANPARNIQQWVRKDREERLKPENNIKIFGRSLLPPEAKAGFEAEIAAIPKTLPGVPVMAQQSDAYWATRITEFTTDVYSLAGLYVMLYRQFSPLVHGTVDSLHRIVRHGSSRGVCRIGVDAQPAKANAFTNTSVVYAMGLLVSGQTLGFPDGEQVRKVFERITR